MQNERNVIKGPIFAHHYPSTLPMRIHFIYTLLFLFSAQASAQVTLVRYAPNDSFHLACRDCKTTIVDLAITRGQNAVPMNMKKPVTLNLLMWRYYDDILKKDVLMADEPFWTSGVQLIDEVPDDEMLSIHLNLVWTDSSGTSHRFYLVMAGLTKHDLSKLPLQTTFDTDTYALLRFTAVSQITLGADDWETYDCLEGSCTLKRLNYKTRSISGVFDFIGNQVGMEKKGFFVDGSFSK